jgi:hypothetical protein
MSDERANNIRAAFSSARLSTLVSWLERSNPASDVTLAECPICKRTISRGGSPCWQCVRGEIERRHGVRAASIVNAVIEECDTRTANAGRPS